MCGGIGRDYGDRSVVRYLGGSAWGARMRSKVCGPSSCAAGLLICVARRAGPRPNKDRNTPQRCWRHGCLLTKVRLPLWLLVCPIRSTIRHGGCCPKGTLTLVAVGVFRWCSRSLGAPLSTLTNNSAQRLSSARQEPQELVWPTYRGICIFSRLP